MFGLLGSIVRFDGFWSSWQLGCVAYDRHESRPCGANTKVREANPGNRIVETSFCAEYDSRAMTK
jgi:hypothetical protein